MNRTASVGTRPSLTDRPWRLFALLTGSTLLTSINFSLIFVAFGDISRTFKHDGSTVAWALTGFSIAAASALVPAGWMADRFGRERILIGGLATFTLGSAFVAWSPSVWVLIFGRIIQAAGLVGESSAALPILLDAFRTDQRATIVGSLGAAGGVAASIGPVLGGALVDNIGWHATFACNVPIGIVLCFVLHKRLPRTPPKPPTAPPDLIGVAALAAGMASLVLAITKINAWGLGDLKTSAAGIAAVSLLTLVVIRSRHQTDPVLFIPLFGDPSYRRGVLLNIMIAGTFAGTFFSFIRLLTDVWHLSTFRAGLAVAVIPLFGGPLSFVSGRIADRRGARTVIVPGTVLIAIAGIVMALFVEKSKNVYGLFLPVSIVYGIGVGFAHAACNSAALRTVPAEHLGIGGAMSRMGMDLGGIISVAVAVAMVATATDPVAGLRRFMILVSGVCIIGGFLAFTMQGPERR